MKWKGQNSMKLNQETLKGIIADWVQAVFSQKPTIKEIRVDYSGVEIIFDEDFAEVEPPPPAPPAPEVI